MIYFLSDAHLGSRLETNPLAQEQKLVRWLEMVSQDATHIYLLGDIFDFWFEYRTVVPKGFVRFLGKLATLVDAGIEIHFLIGNHDLWTFGYLEKEVGLKVHYKPMITEHHGKRFFLAHGDGLTNAGSKFNILRKVFHSNLAQQLFSLLPPYFGQHFGYHWSKNNRTKYMNDDDIEMKNNQFNEDLVNFAMHYQSENPIDYFVFGHRHIDLKVALTNDSQVVILGDFIKIFSYGVFDGEKLTLQYFEQANN